MGVQHFSCCLTGGTPWPLSKAKPDMASSVLPCCILDHEQLVSQPNTHRNVLQA